MILWLKMRLHQGFVNDTNVSYVAFQNAFRANGDNSVLLAQLRTLDLGRAICPFLILEPIRIPKLLAVQNIKGYLYTCIHKKSHPEA